MREQILGKALKQASQKLSISKDEIRACYAQGEEAVIALVESLVARINALEARIEVLENQKSKDSKNSSKPPSGDGFAKRTKSLRTKSGRPSGGQKDHPGSTLEWREEVDEVFIHPVVECTSCGTSLELVEVLSLRCSQVHELPPIKLVISRSSSRRKVLPKLRRNESRKITCVCQQFGAMVKSKLMWLHVACNGWLTAYFIEPKRGQLAMNAIDILPSFEGISVHDGLASYGKYHSIHALCNAHHLRELRFIVERYEQDWASDMITLLVEIKTTVSTAQADGKTSLSFTQLADFERRYQELIETGLIVNPPPPIDLELPTISYISDQARHNSSSSLKMSEPTRVMMVFSMFTARSIAVPSFRSIYPLLIHPFSPTRMSQNCP